MRKAVLAVLLLTAAPCLAQFPMGEESKEGPKSEAASKGSGPGGMAVPIYG